MWWFRRKSKSKDAKANLPAADLAHLEQFAQTRRGVEAFLEPKTSVTDLTVVLIAHDGEWTRRRIGTEQAAYNLGQRLGIPVYDANRVGYPQRMRDWNSRNRAGKKT
jgi:hypothetical protein